MTDKTPTQQAVEALGKLTLDDIVTIQGMVGFCIERGYGLGMDEGTRHDGSPKEQTKRLLKFSEIEGANTIRTALKSHTETPQGNGPALDIINSMIGNFTLAKVVACGFEPDTDELEHQLDELNIVKKALEAPQGNGPALEALEDLSNAFSEFKEYEHAVSAFEGSTRFFGILSQDTDKVPENICIIEKTLQSPPAKRVDVEKERVGSDADNNRDQTHNR